MQVATANRICSEYNSGLTAAASKVEEHNRIAKQELLEVRASKATIQKCLLPTPQPCPDLNSRWCRRFLELFNWSKRSLNTQGNFLEYNDPRLKASRQALNRHISHGGVHPHLILNVDQLWRQQLRFGKFVFMKKTSRVLE